MKKIRVFIGSSIEELALERAELMRFIGGLNNKYVDRGLYIEGYVCEETPASMRAGGSQKAHNDYIKADADATIFMFYHKAGEYTMEELRLAREAFLAGGRPDVFVFFKAVDKAHDIAEDVQKAVDLVANEYGHYYKLFNDVDTVKLELLEFLADAMGGKGALTVKDGKVYLNGEAVEGIAAANVFAYQNNPELKRLREKKDALLRAMTEASARGDEDEALRISVELTKAQKAYHELETEILGIIKLFHDENRKGRKADPRRMEALRLLELGRVAEAKRLIPQEELDQRAASIETRAKLETERLNDERRELIDDARVRIQTLRADAENPERFREIEHAYDSAYEAAKEAKEYDFIYSYALFLWELKHYPKGIEKAELLRYLFDNPENRDYVTDNDRASLLNLLGNLYYENKDLKKVEAVYRGSLDLSRSIFKAEPTPDNESEVAMICNNLGLFNVDHGKPNDALELYLEALEIRRRVAETVSSEEYESDVAATCNNLAALYDRFGRPQEAEKLYLEAIEIYRRISTVSREAYEADVAGICNNLANLYMTTNKPKEAEELHLEALEIRRRLAKAINPEAYEPDVAETCNNLAGLYEDTGRQQEAEKLFLEALEIRNRLAETVSRGAYEPDVAATCYNIARLYQNTGRPREAEQLYLEALEILRRLAETISREAYEPDVAGTCNNLAVLYKNTGRPKEAEQLYLEAYDIYVHLMETVSGEVYAPSVAGTCNNLATLYQNTGRSQEAEQFYREALGIYLRLVETASRETYEPDLAGACINIAAFFVENGKFMEAKNSYVRAFEIYRRLSETVSRETYEPLVAVTCFDMGILEQQKLNDSDRGIKFFSAALSIAKRYKDVDPVCKQIVDALS